MKKKITSSLFALLLMVTAGCQNVVNDSPNDVIDGVIGLVEQYFNWIYEGRILAHSDTDEVNCVTDMLKTVRKNLYVYKKNTASEAGLKICISDFKNLMEYPLNEEDRGHFEQLTDSLLDMIYHFQDLNGAKFFFYLYQNFGSIEEKGWSAVSVIGDQEWATDEFGNPPPCGTMSGYSNTSNENEDWLISPEIDFAGLTHAELSFQEAINYDYGTAGAYEQVMISTNYTGNGNPNTAAWTVLTVPDRSPGTSWTFYQTGKCDLSSYLGETSVYIAFKYRSTSAKSSTWEIDNILIEGKSNN